ncbi:hypothetical protein DNHGIG_05400 [Collibacillus ludicampi]|uniref:Uncharacterized protein n=1 Tax=Collibacillus ludicampi TaxID=2771369 RepID=A0AAV4LB39_9BACL|nr:hypothetical protein [Collibacillus ludicampi]GIM44991.1 hypothetical protein DNHGIG_05400 [Collibacillus ludicampi]
MLTHPKTVRLDQDTLHVHIPQVAGMIEKWLSMGEAYTGLSIRWALARMGNEPAIVIGVRHQGRGFDILFRREHWNDLSQQPEQLMIHYKEDETDPQAQIAVEIPPGSFDAFIEDCQAQYQTDPGKTIMGEIASYFA